MSIRDAFRALTGRLPGTYVRWSDLDTIERRILDWESTIVTTLERMNAWYARESKRQKRQIERRADALEAPPTMATPAPADRKAELRRRAFGGANLPGRMPPPGGPPNVDGDQG